MGVVRLFFLYAFLSLLCLDDTKTRAINIHRGFPWCFSPRKRYDFKNQGDILRLRCFSQKKTPKLARCVFAKFAANRGATMWPCIQHRGIPYQSTPKNLPRPVATKPLQRWCLKPTLPETPHVCTWKKRRLIEDKTRKSSEASIFRCEDLLVSGRAAPTKPDTNVP